MKALVERSDPDQPIQYLGTILANHTSAFEHWCVMNTNLDGECLFINDQLQSCIRDEAVYTETMVHGLLSGVRSPKTVLVIGQGDGCLLREVLRWPTVQSVTHVCPHEALSAYFQTEGCHWNNAAYNDKRVKTIYESGLDYLRTSWADQRVVTYDAVFIDTLDPHTEDDMKELQSMLLECRRYLAPGGGIALNAGLVKKGVETPASALATFIKSEFKDPQYHRVAWHVNIPSYLGEWAFLMITSKGWSGHIHSARLPSGLKFYTKDVLVKATQWDSDFPVALQSFWKPTSSWAGVASLKS